MPGTSPGMTRRVGRSDGSHPQACRRPQPAPPLHPLGGAPVRTRTGSAERDRASVLIERFPCLCTTLPFRHGRACPGHPYGHAPVKRPGGGRCPDTRGYLDTRNQSGQVRASPGMTRWVGRSDGSHPQACRRPQPAPPLHPLGGAPVRTRTGSAERDRASVLIERFPCLCTTLPFRHGRACPGHPYGHAPVKRPGGGRFPDTRIPGYPEPVRASPGTSGHDEEGGPVGWIASPRTQTATACSPSPPTISYPSGAGREVNHFPQAPGARSARLATRHAARGAVAPSGPLRSPVPVSGERLIGCRARRLLSRSPGRRPGARDCAPRRMARRQASGARARR